MRPAHPCRRLPFPHPAWLLGLLLLAGPSGCGPAASDQAAHVEPRAGLGGLSESPPVTPETTPVPLASVNGTGAKPGMGTLPGRDSLQVVSAPSPHPVDSPDTLVVPAWMAKELDSPDVRVRLQALDRWGQQAPTGSVDPLILALEDKDERVQARALELIEQDWVRAQSAKAEAGQ